ncbi:LysR substrate-binding domain-containing protein [Muricoccus aerilatus]|uniref:LysR substrate-binding domain-containing protein n=1 Tax=Muricoccus aerilatus TaxID=452982 RepID=UPI002480C78C|nr:LysR substrate-binding domain-containing protein [Roseomonas aerilata]
MHSRQRPEDWPRWLAAAGIEVPDPTRGPRFESIALALDAAAEGLGVALAIRALVGADVTAGRVVAPYPFIRTTTRSFTLLHDAERETDPALAALRAWLGAEAAREGFDDLRRIYP